MARIKHLVILLLFNVVALTAGAQVSPEKVSSSRVQKSVKAVLGVEKEIQWESLPVGEAHKEVLSAKLQSFGIIPDTLYMGSVRSEGKQYWVIPNIAPSKSETFSYLLYLDKDYVIVDVDVLHYRESYGYEIDYPFFREQFHGITDPGKIKFRRSIQNISGATISVQSITQSVRNMLTVIKEVRKNQ